jgi:CRP-like cAMP-binding protein
MLGSDAALTTSVERAVSGLVRNCDLQPSIIERVRSAHIATARYPSGAVVAAPPGASDLLWFTDGWACECRELPDGRRQIFSFVLPGDVVADPPFSTGRTIRALTLVECGDAGELIARAGGADDIHAALMRAVALADARRYAHLARLTARSALTRLASLMIELHDRLEALGLVRNGEFPLPLRHEELADALGLSPLHVTRCLRSLREQCLMALQFRRVSGFDREGLQRLCAP